MARNGLTLLELAVSGRGESTASVQLSTGLNVIVGASNTGKTHIFEQINFLLGGNKPPESVPQAQGFARATLWIRNRAGAQYRIHRSLSGGDFILQTADSQRTLAARHAEGDESTLSGFLLAQTGLAGRYIRTDAHGATTSMSFRDVCKLILVGEEQIIRRSSPVLTGEVVSATRERSVFACFLTGVDDSTVVRVEKPSEQRARLETQRGMVESLLLEKQGQLDQLTKEPERAAANAAQLDAEIAVATSVLISSQQEIDQLAAERRGLNGQQQKETSRCRFLDEQLVRLRLLADFYTSDKARLEAVIEATLVLHDLPGGECPMCGQDLPYEEERSARAHDQFHAACTQEIAKIDALAFDLTSAIAEFEHELDGLRASVAHRHGQLVRLNEQMQRMLEPRKEVAGDIQRLVTLRTALAEVVALTRAVRELKGHLARIESELAQKRKKVKFAQRVTVSAASRFSEIAYDTLKTWRYPSLGPVVFDPEKLDFVIGGQDRQSMGKGYRALTYAAFTISLMRYCREQSLPHPGFVVLDTPLNPFKGPTTNEESLDAVRVLDEVKQAFYESLAADISGDQIVVMENTEPPTALRANIRYEHFSSNPSVGRFGFYPSEPSPNQSERAA